MGDSYTALKDFYHQLLHSGSTMECFENLVEPWTDRQVEPGCPPPHSWGSSKQALMVRNFLVMEYGGKCGLDMDKRELWLFHCLSPAWVLPGKKVAITNAPTEFGSITANMAFTNNGARIVIQKKFSTNPACYRIRMPYFKNLVGYTTNGTTHRQEGDCIVVSPDATFINITWRDKPAANKGTVAEMLTSYRTADKFAGVAADGNAIITPGKSFLLDGEQSDTAQPLSFALVQRTFAYEYKRLANEQVKSGLPLLTVEGVPMLSADERKRVYLGVGKE